MLGCTCRIHLGIQWPRIQCSRAYAQHQHGRLQALCPTLPNYRLMCSRASCSTQMFQASCAPELLTQHKYKYSCDSDPFSQHKTSIYPCTPELLTQHKTSHQSCASGSTPNTRKHTHTHTHTHTYIISNWLTPSISNKSSC